MIQKVETAVDFPFNADNQHSEDLLGFMIGYRGSDKFYISDFLKSCPIDWETINEDDLIDEAWDIARMLPGGVKVLGVYVISSKDIFAESEITSALTPILKNLCNMEEDGYSVFPRCQDHYYQNILLHLNPLNKQHLFKKYDPDLKTWSKLDFSAVRTKWIKITSICYLFKSMRIDPEFDGSDIAKTMEEKLYEQVNNMTVVFAYSQREGTETLEKFYKSLWTKLEKPDKNADNDCQKFDECIPAVFYTPTSSLANTKAKAKVLPSGNCCISGSFDCYAFLPKECTLADAEQALKYDLIRYIRIALDEAIKTLNKDQSITMDLPVKVALDTDKFTIDFYDYFFVEENIVNNFKENCLNTLHIDIDEMDIKLPAEFAGVISRHKLSFEQKEQNIPPKVNFTPMMIILPLITILLSLLFAYYNERNAI